ncbi:O-antigen ligase family protein [Curtobacterium sp. RHCKG23]|uniref:O-antigen ligase family protein n=1 Tax=Curtobacterium citri TaxID=3055139 RepID=A0ABT7T9D7_9MICO|nr:O-antigen ligase family protein [Curtobacterium citri]MDM7886171.1 O-antigen ligase family protein [Curtobacterium citri]
MAILALLLLALPVGTATIVFFVCVFLVFCVRFAVVAWLGYVASFCMSGLGLQIGGVYFQPEMICLPLLLLAVRGTVRDDYARSDKRHYLLLWTGVVLWLGANLAASLLTAPQPVKSLRIIALVSCSVLAFALLQRLKPGIAVRYLVGAATLITVYGVVILSAWAVAQASGRTNVLVVLNYGETVYRTKGLMIEPNLLGSLLALTMCALFFLREHVHRFVLASSMAVMGATAFLSFTRAAWVGMVVLLAVWAFTGHRAVLKTAGIVIASVFSLGIIGTVFTKAGQILGATFSDRVGGLLDFDSGTGAYRARIWEVALSDYVHSPHFLLGLGTNSFSQRHAAQDSSSGEAYLGNFWIALLHDSGLIGAVGFLLIALAIVLRSRSVKAVPLYFTLVVTAFATNPMWFAFPWVCLALMLSVGRLPIERSDDGERRHGIAVAV